MGIRFQIFTFESSMANKNKDKKIVLNLDFIKNERFNFLSGLFLIAFGFYILFVMISFLFTWKTDNIDWISIFSGADIQVENWGGKLGAYISNTFITKWFGLPSFGISFIFVTWGASLLGHSFFSLKKIIIYGSIIIILSSLALGIIDNSNQNINFLLGGQHGYFIVEWLNSFLGQIGTIILLSIAIISFIISVSNKAFEILKSWVQPSAKNKEDDEESEPLAKDDTLENDFTTNDDKDNEDIALELSFDDKEEIDIEPSQTNMPLVSNTEEFSISKESEENSEQEELELTNTTIDELEETQENEEDLGLEVEDLVPEEESENKQTPLEILGEYDPKADLSHFKFPNVDILADHEVNNVKVTQEELNENKDKIVETLRNYKIEISNISATIGPSITLYEIVPAPGVRISKIKNLEDDIALSLAALGIRIIAPMPGKGTVGIEVPNKNPQVVSMRSTIASKVFQESKFELPIVLGKTIYNKTHVIDLAKTPHMLVAGATGQGKSVGINAILTSLLYKKHPAELKLVLIDPKKVELSIYSRIEKHYLAKLPEEEDAIITDVQKVVATLNSLAKEMDARYDLLKNGHVRNIIEYNKKFIDRKLNPDKGHRFLPYIVVVIDEFADLIMTAGKEVEHPIARIAQLARAIGIHLIVATQRPAVNVITGMIKANFPTRVAFRVTQAIDSRTILDTSGANQLIGRGDMLVSQGGGEMIRLQCPFVDTPEVEELVVHIEGQQSYPTALLLPEPDAEALGLAPEVDMKQKDELFEDAARLMVQTQQGSTSSIQRKFSIGYNRAGRIIDQLEASGVVGPYEGSKARKVLFPDEYTLEQFLKSLD